MGDKMEERPQHRKPNPRTVCETVFDLHTPIHASSSSKKGSYTINFKLHALQRLRELNGNVSATAKELKVDRKRIRDWREQETSITNVAKKFGDKTEGMKERRCLPYNRGGTFAEMEKLLYHWVTAKKNEGVIVNGLTVREKAKELIQTTDPGANFNASHGWLCRFLRRFKLSRRRSVSKNDELGVESKLQQNELQTTH